MDSMDFIPPVQVKVTGLRSIEDARRAVSFGVTALGFLADGPDDESLPLAAIADMSDAVGPDIGTFLATRAREPAHLVALALRTRVNTLQLWEPLPAGAYDEIRRAAPGLAIAQSIHVIDDDAVARAIAMSGLADALVLDGVDPYGIDTDRGSRPDWQVCRRIVDSVQMPVVLSGGLTSRNVVDAIRAVRPFGVDVRPVDQGAFDLHHLVDLLEVIGRIHP